MLTLIKIAWRNTFYRPLGTLLSVLLVALGVGLASFLLQFSKQLTDHFDRNLAGVDLIIGAKGSPLQSVLCNLYHVDLPTGNIKIEEAAAFLRKEHPLIAQRVPLLLGDNYKKYRIVGTSYDFLNLYSLEFATGRKWNKPFETVLGCEVAADLGLKINDHFRSSHGLVDDLDEHQHEFTVTGILKPSGTVVDQLILCGPKTVWESHADNTEHEDGHDHEGEVGHSEFHEKNLPDTLAEQFSEFHDKEITALLIVFKNRNFQTLNFGRNININTEMMASSPSMELSKLFASLGIGQDVLKWLLIALLTLGGLSLFVSLLQALKDRAYELAVMRLTGAKPWQLSFIILLESLIVSILGVVAGLLLAHTALILFARYATAEYRYRFNGWTIDPQEYLLIGVMLAIGVIASLIPAWKAYKTDIALTLASK